MDLNRLAALGCCSWYFNRKAKNTKKENTNPSSQSDVMTKKELKSRRKQFGICLKCGQTLTDYKFCQSCSSKEFQSKFNDWTSEDLCIDKFIQGSQLKATNNQSYLLWIPFDDFINVKYLANGGFASVYSARWDHFETGDIVDVVLKRLHNGQISNPEFLKEQVSMLLYGAMNNSNIVKCYGFTKHPTEGYMLVLEQAEDGDLRGFLRKQSSTFLWSEKLFILREISKSLELLHQREFVHGDLHTGNILKTNDQRRSCRILKNNKKCRHENLEIIVDLPLYFDSNTSYTSPFGVIPYVAPEVFEKGYYTKQTDIYSFAIIMWELATYQQPFFKYSNEKDLVHDIRNGIRPEIDDQQIPKCVLDLMEKCWDPKPFNRPSAQTITSIIDEWIWILSASKIRLSNKSRDILNQFSLANNNTKKKVKLQSRLPPSLARSSTLLRNNIYYSKSLSKYLIIMDVEKTANAASFAASTNSVNFDTDGQDDSE
ncbi:6997_t:CDS:2 [Funneliformis geosporum]|uniref:8789_t:CDS:1 n=1 Tax=Funneliformis geosporum TaxID=1117311 RepID=A0A9W4WW67_9GLOM|nr:8789_t:CDS:2 [Funneliformis geosporum]CAI2188558.1 6997_t:CDS:2 [Funneliformis geosporum]